MLTNGANHVASLSGPFSSYIPPSHSTNTLPVPGHRFGSPGTTLTSPAAVVAVLPVEAALGVGDLCRVTNAMAGSWGWCTGRPMWPGELLLPLPLLLLLAASCRASDTYSWRMEGWRQGGREGEGGSVSCSRSSLCRKCRRHGPVQSGGTCDHTIIK